MGKFETHCAGQHFSHTSPFRGFRGFMVDYHIIAKTPKGHYIVANYAGIQDMNFKTHKRNHVDEIEVSGTEFLDTLVEAGALEPHEVEAVAKAWNIETTRLDYVWGQQERKEIDYDEAEFHTRISAYTFQAIVENRGAVTHPEILKATEEELEDWKKEYLKQIRHTHNRMRDREENHGRLYMEEDPIWARAHGTIVRKCYNLWQVKRRLGEA